MNDICYHHEKLNIDNSLFPIIDCSYVMIMDRSRYELDVRKQLKKYPLSKKIILQWNRGFKNCQKKLFDQVSVADLADSFKLVLHNALINDYNHILILEEDFIIDERIENIKYREEITDFLVDEEPNILLLGSILWNTGEKKGNFIRVKWKTGTHAIILNRKTIKYLHDLMENNENLIDIDNITNQYVYKKYSYKIPLIMQVWNDSDNKKNWGKGVVKNENIRQLNNTMYSSFLEYFGFTQENTIKKAFHNHYEIHFNTFYKLLAIILNIISTILGKNEKN